MHRLKRVASVAFGIRRANAYRQHTDWNAIEVAAKEFDRLADLSVRRPPGRHVIPTSRRGWSGTLESGNDRTCLSLQCAHEQPSPAGRRHVQI